VLVEMSEPRPAYAHVKSVGVLSCTASREYKDRMNECIASSVSLEKAYVTAVEKNEQPRRKSLLHINIKCILTTRNMRHTEEKARKWVSRRLLDNAHSQSAALSDMNLKPPRRMVRFCFTR
jgi:hypothetical protein